MARGKKRSGRFEVEWVTVAYRTIVHWAVALGAVALVATGIVLWVVMGKAGEREEVERILALAERSLQAIPDRPEFQDERGQVVEKLNEARRQLAADDLVRARRAAEAAREVLRRLESRAEDTARMLQVEGSVQVKRVGGLEWTEARMGMPLGVGDLVKTGHGSGAQFVNLDGSTLTLREDTVARIDRSAKDLSGKTDVAVEVTAGRLTVVSDAQTPGSKSEVKTPEVSADVESNTILGVGFDEAEGRSLVDVIQGRARLRIGDTAVDVESSERVTVASGEMEKKRLPAVPRLVSPPMYKLILERDLGTEPLELEWESARDARSYKVELGQTPLFTRLEKHWENHTATFVAAGPLVVGRSYWGVTAIDRDGIEGGPSPASVFRISDAEPQGDPPPLEITNIQPLGEEVFLVEGKTRQGVYLSIDDGTRVTFFEPQERGLFRQIITIPYEGIVILTVTARDSQGLETSVRRRIEVRLP